MKNNLIKQILRFGVVGGIAFLIDYALLYFCTEYLNIYVLYSSIISFSVSVIFNYIMSIKWVFDVDHKQTYKDFTIFIILSLIGLGINQLVMFVGVEKLGIFYMLVKIISTAIVMVYNFITRKIFIEKNNNKNILEYIKNLIYNNKKIVSVFMASFTYAVICLTNHLRAYDVYSWLIYLVLIIVFIKTDLYSDKMKKESIIFSLLFSILMIYGNITYSLLDDPTTSLFKNFFTVSSLIKIIGTFNLLLVIFKNVLPKLYDFSLTKKKSKIKKTYLIFIISFVIMLIAWLPYFLAFFPGTLSSDSFAELSIIVNNFVYITDHHPVIHLLFILLPYKIGYGIFGSMTAGVALVTICQMIVLAAIFSSSIVFLHKRKVNDFILLIVLLFYSFAPMHGYYSIVMWKDVIFAGTLLLLTMEAIKIIEKDKRNELCFKNIIGFIITSIFCVFFRNNAIYMYLVFAIVTFIIFRKHIKMFAVAFAIVFGVFLFVKGPVFNYLNINKSASAEYISMPLQQIGRMAFKEVGFTKKEASLINKVIPVDILAKSYNPIVSDNIKFNKAYNGKAFDENKLDYLKLYLSLVCKHPDVALEAYSISTLGYWYPGVDAWPINDSIYEENEYGLKMQSKTPESVKNALLSTYSKNAPILSIEWSIGLCFWIILIFGTISVKKNGLKGVYPYVPVFGIWLTMMIAAPAFSEFRYVYGAFTSLPILMLCPYILNGSIYRYKDNK